MKNNKNIGFLGNTGPDPLKITKLSSQHSILGYQWHASETPKMLFCLRDDDGPFIAVFGSSIPLSTKNVIKFGPPLEKPF